MEKHKEKIKFLSWLLGSAFALGVAWSTLNNRLEALEKDNLSQTMVDFKVDMAIVKQKQSDTYDHVLSIERRLNRLTR